MSYWIQFPSYLLIHLLHIFEVITVKILDKHPCKRTRGNVLSLMDDETILISFKVCDAITYAKRF
jgi:hypothetical protein